MNVLLVEDHQDTCSVLNRILSDWGHNVFIARNLRAGLDQLRENRFDVIVSDIALPDGSGYALMTKARHAGSKAVGIAISAYPYPPDVEEPKLTGFDHHLNKPFTPRQLRALMPE